MSAWWDGLTALQHILYCVAIPATVVMLIQTVLMIVGFGGHGDMSGGGPISGGVGHDIPHDAIVIGHSGIGHGGLASGTHDLGAGTAHDGQAVNGNADLADLVSFRLFTFQSILAFLVVFGWTGVAMSANKANGGFATIAVSLVAGTAALFLTAWMFYGILKLQNSGNVRLSNAVGLVGEVYIPIPANGRGQGKVNLLLQGRWFECDAVTASLEALKTSQAVRIVGVQGGSVLVVEPNK